MKILGICATKDDALNDEIGLAMARHVGLRVAEVAGKIQNK